MDPTPVIPPGAADALTPAMYGALGYIALSLLTWAGKNGLPMLKDAMGLVSQRDKEMAAAAKEGPIMVLERVERQLAASEERAAKQQAESEARAAKLEAEHARQLNEVLAELREFRKAHHDCETKYAGLQAEVTYLRRELAELKGEQEQ